jgi:hypothetical protein
MEQHQATGVLKQHLKYVKSKDTYLIKKKYLKYTTQQTGGSVNHKLFNKIAKSKNKKETIKKEEAKLMKKIKKMTEMEKHVTKEGFISFEFFLLVSQMTTLKDIEDDPNFKFENVVNAGELWGKLYINYLMKKKGMTKEKILAILTRDTK